MKIRTFPLLALVALLSSPALAIEPPRLQLLSAEVGAEGTAFHLGWSSPDASMVAAVLGGLPSDARVTGLEEGVLLRPEDGSSLVASLVLGSDMTSVIFVPEGAPAPRVAWGLVAVVSRTPAARASLELLASGPLLDLEAEMSTNGSSVTSPRPFSGNLRASALCEDAGNEVHYSWQGDVPKRLIIDVMVARSGNEIGSDRWQLLRSVMPAQAQLAGGSVLDAASEAEKLAGRSVFPYLVVAKQLVRSGPEGSPWRMVVLETRLVVAACR